MSIRSVNASQATSANTSTTASNGDHACENLVGGVVSRPGDSISRADRNEVRSLMDQAIKAAGATQHAPSKNAASNPIQTLSQASDQLKAFDKVTGTAGGIDLLLNAISTGPCTATKTQH